MSRATRGKVTAAGVTYREKARERALAAKEAPRRLIKDQRMARDALQRRIFKDTEKAAKRIYRAAGTLEEKRAAARELRKSQETLERGLKDEKSTKHFPGCKPRPEPEKKAASGAGSRPFIPWCEAREVRKRK